MRVPLPSPRRQESGDLLSGCTRTHGDINPEDPAREASRGCQLAITGPVTYPVPPRFVAEPAVHLDDDTPLDVLVVVNGIPIRGTGYLASSLGKPVSPLDVAGEPHLRRRVRPRDDSAEDFSHQGAVPDALTRIEFRLQRCSRHEAPLYAACQPGRCFVRTA